MGFILFIHTELNKEYNINMMIPITGRNDI